MSVPKRFHLLLLFTICTLSIPAQIPSSTAIDISSISMLKEIRPFVSTAFINPGQELEGLYPSLKFQPGTVFNGPLPNNYVVKKALMRFSVINSSDSISSVYFFPGFYCRSVQLYEVKNNVPIALPDIMPEHSQGSGYRLLRLSPGDTMQVIAELNFLKTYSNKMRPRLIHKAFLGSFLLSVRSINSESDMATYIFCGLLLMMILYSLANYFQGAHREFLYYSGYAFLLGVMLFTKALYNYHTDNTSFFLEEYLDFILQSLGIIFYMLFMKRFLGTRNKYPFLNKLYNGGILLLVLSIFTYSYFHYATDNFPAENQVENLTKILLLLMVVIFLSYSFRHWQDRLFRYLFWGNLFFLFFSLFSMVLILFPQAVPVSGLAGNSLIYYEAGLLVELVFFLAALNHKNWKRIIEETRVMETLKAQNLLKEYEKEMAVYRAQKEERERISADMHDELGSGITAIRLMSEIARNKMKENTPVEIDKISQSADDVLNKMNAIIWSMNSSNDTLDNLVVFIRTYALEYFENTPVHCSVDSPENIPPGELTGEKRRNIFLCVKESLNNVLKHAQASEVKIAIEVNHVLNIRITDNGRGTDFTNLRQFGNGLKNITRRMQSIGGSFRIESNRGTISTLTLPL